MLSFFFSLIEEGGDWDRRNRLKVYKGYYSLIVRDFKTAACNFLESISTFTSYELMSYKKFVEYTVLLSIISLKRAELGKKVIIIFLFNILLCCIMNSLLLDVTLMLLGHKMFRNLRESS